MTEHAECAALGHAFEEKHRYFQGYSGLYTVFWEECQRCGEKTQERWEGGRDKGAGRHRTKGHHAKRR